MARHKRKRPKNRRAGCLMCKPHKMNGAKKTKSDLGKYWGQDEIDRLLGVKEIRTYNEAILFL